MYKYHLKKRAEEEKANAITEDDIAMALDEVGEEPSPQKKKKDD